MVRRGRSSAQQLGGAKREVVGVARVMRRTLEERAQVELELEDVAVLAIRGEPAVEQDVTVAAALRARVERRVQPALGAHDHEARAPAHRAQQPRQCKRALHYEAAAAHVEQYSRAVADKFGIRGRAGSATTASMGASSGFDRVKEPIPFARRLISATNKVIQYRYAVHPACLEG